MVQFPFADARLVLVALSAIPKTWLGPPLRCLVLTREEARQAEAQARPVEAEARQAAEVRVRELEAALARRA
jgi:hypothetical protein